MFVWLFVSVYVFECNTFVSTHQSEAWKGKAALSLLISTFSQDSFPLTKYFTKKFKCKSISDETFEMNINVVWSSALNLSYNKILAEWLGIIVKRTANSWQFSHAHIDIVFNSKSDVPFSFFFLLYLAK